LEHIDPDRGQAIVKLTKRVLRSEKSAQSPVEIVEVAKDTGLVVIGPSRALRKIPFLHLIEVAPARYLLALDPSHDFRTLEIAIGDVLDDLPEGETREGELVMQLLEHIRRLRKTERVSMAKILFVKLERPALKNRRHE
jgi:hypothetical protein